MYRINMLEKTDDKVNVLYDVLPSSDNLNNLELHYAKIDNKLFQKNYYMNVITWMPFIVILINGLSAVSNFIVGSFSTAIMSSLVCVFFILAFSGKINKIAHHKKGSFLDVLFSSDSFDKMYKRMITSIVLQKIIKDEDEDNSSVIFKDLHIKNFALNKIPTAFLVSDVDEIVKDIWVADEQFSAVQNILDRESENEEWEDYMDDLAVKYEMENEREKLLHEIAKKIGIEDYEIIPMSDFS